MSFVHLHVHSQYSLLDGEATIPHLVDKALADGMPGIALTDHGNMFGIKEFFNYCKGVKGKAKKTLKALQAEAEQGLLTPEQEEEKARAERTVAFKPIFGCEMYVARRGNKHLMEGKQDQSGWHLIVLAKNEAGYHNLVKLVSRSWVDGFYMRPRTDYADLEELHENLIICSACIGGEIPKKILSGDLEGAEERVRWFKQLMGDDFYLELQRHPATPNLSVRANRECYPMQQEVNAKLIEWSKKYDIPLVCTNDVHFVNEEDAEAHDLLICLATAKDLNDPSRMLYTKQEWLKTSAEMQKLFADVPEALENTVRLLEKVETYSIDSGPIMPNFAIPEEFGTEETYHERFTDEELFQEFTCDEKGKQVLSREDAEAKVKVLGGIQKLYRLKLEADYLGHLTQIGARKKYGDPVPEEVQERLEFELHIMKTMGFPGYFLIVWDYIRAAREELDVSVGPGRGSAAGSAVAYCLDITQIDPIKYDLLFERFLNPDRISLPDIDVDFDDDGRGRVLQWVTDKYGADNVAHIITYGTMATKSAIADVARVLKLPLSESKRLCKLIPIKLPEGKDGKSPKLNLPNAIAAISELRDAALSPDPLLSETMKYAQQLEGTIRGTGVHACGFIICRDKIEEHVPVSVVKDKATGETLHCTQYEGRVIEETGLIKMDFLGLKTLTIIREAVANIKQSRGIDVDIDTIPIDDPATFKLYQEGRTIGTFQFESAGMQKYLRELKPTTFEDLIAMNALYRPGPMQYIPQFIKRKHGEEPITYDLPCMERYLVDTYGITVYQEQVMLLSREIADFTRGESDALRKAMGKKLIDKLNHMHPKFVSGGKAKGYDENVLEKIWNDWRAFASYAFNKSHATCYSWVAYQTAYLKANFPAEYMAGVMSSSLSDTTTLTKLMDECRAMGIRCLGPDINESRMKFTVTKNGDIRFGLAAIKGVGEGAVAEILRERDANGAFKSIYDLVERISLQACNRRVMENLVISGALDNISSASREQLLGENSKQELFLEQLIRYGQRIQEERRSPVMSLFGDQAEAAIMQPQPPSVGLAWSELERLNKEKELVGIYLSSHPLDAYRIILERVCTISASELSDLSPYVDNEAITVGGIVTDVRIGQTKTGKPFGIVRLEDIKGGGDIALFGEAWAPWSGFFNIGAHLFITGRAERRRSDETRVDFRVGRVEFLSDVKDKVLTSITIRLRLDQLEPTFFDDLLEMLDEQPEGNTSVSVMLYDVSRDLHVNLASAGRRINPNASFFNFCTDIEGVEIQIN